MYHGIAEVGSDPWSLCVSPRHFAEHLEVLQHFGHLMRLQDLSQNLREGSIPRHSVAVTFDDGYANNLHNAKPLLERYDIPATIFLTTGYIGSEREFWWDELDRLLLQPGRLPETLCLKVNGGTYRWELGEVAYYSEDTYRRDRNRKAWEGEPGSRHALFYSLWQLLRPLWEEKRRITLDELVTWAGVDPVARPTHRALLAEEVGTLGEGDLIEIGSHTVTHPFLSMHPATFQSDEIQQSKAYLEDITGRPVMSFAYPHGDYTKETVALVKKAGFTCACSSIENTVWRYTDCFTLPRFEVHNWNGEEFARRLSRAFAPY